jgi:hypothetical protein
MESHFIQCKEILTHPCRAQCGNVGFPESSDRLQVIVQCRLLQQLNSASRNNEHKHTRMTYGEGLYSPTRDNVCGLSCNAFSTPLQTTKPISLYYLWTDLHDIHISRTLPLRPFLAMCSKNLLLKLLLVMYLLVTIIHDYLRGNPSLLFGRPYQVVFPTHGVATHFYGRSCVSRPYGAGDPTHKAITVEGERWL